MVDPQRLNAELKRLKQLIQTDPRVKARFDKDGNGVIDGQEWEEVRQLVIKRLERKEAEARAAAAAAQEAASGEAPEGEVAVQLFAEDLRPLPPEPKTASSAGDHAVLILEQQGGLGQVFEGLVRRNYLVYAADGRPIAQIDQVESEVMQEFTQKGFSLPDLNFRVYDRISNERLLLEKSESLAQGTRITVIDARGGHIAHTHFRGRLLERKAMAYSSLSTHGLEVTRRLLKPWTYVIKTEFGDEVGSIERGWSGLGGFLTGGNKMRIQLSPERANPGLMWALVATALMFDLSQEPEDGSSGAGIRL